MYSIVVLKCNVLDYSVCKERTYFFVGAMDFFFLHNRLLCKQYKTISMEMVKNCTDMEAFFIICMPFCSERRLCAQCTHRSTLHNHPFSVEMHSACDVCGMNSSAYTRFSIIQLKESQQCVLRAASKYIGGLIVSIDSTMQPIYVCVCVRFVEIVTNCGNQKSGKKKGRQRGNKNTMK